MGYQVAWDTMPHGIPRRTGYHVARDTTRAEVEQLAIRVRARLDPRTRLRISGPRSDHSASCAA